MMDDFKDDKTQSPSAEVFSRSVDSPNETAQSIAEPVTYRLYKRRFIGLVALVSTADIHDLFHLQHIV